MKIILLGYMGSGKSTVGALLAKELDCDLLDLDTYIESGEDLKIPEIFDKKGEIYFRRKEAQYLMQVLQKDHDFVLSVGGGTPCYGTNMDEIINATPNVFYLKVSVAGLSERLKKEKEERPLISNIEDGRLAEFIGKHLFERRQFYDKAHHIIECDHKSAEDIMGEIANKLI